VSTETQEMVRTEVLETLLTKVEADTYPSTTMLDIIESLIGPDEIDDYAEILLGKIRAENYPSLDLIRRLVTLSQ
jgi:hypothetical protein